MKCMYRFWGFVMRCGGWGVQCAWACVSGLNVANAPNYLYLQSFNTGKRCSEVQKIKIGCRKKLRAEHSSGVDVTFLPRNYCFVIWKHQHWNTQHCNFDCYLSWVWNLVFVIDVWTFTEVIRELFVGPKEDNVTGVWKQLRNENIHCLFLSLW